MRFLLAPLLTLVLSVGLRPAEIWSLHGQDGRDIESVALTNGAIPDWEIIDEFVGIERATSISVTVTGYSSTRDQCDQDPFITASNKRVRTGIIALSRDLLQRYNPEAPFNWGDSIYLKGVGEFIVEDSMNARYSRRADIWFPDRRSASNWGVQTLQLVAIPEASLFH